MLNEDVALTGNPNQQTRGMIKINRVSEETIQKLFDENEAIRHADNVGYGILDFRSARAIQCALDRYAREVIQNIQPGSSPWFVALSDLVRRAHILEAAHQVWLRQKKERKKK